MYKRMAHRRVLGEKVAEQIVTWLNAAKRKASHDRIERLLDNLGRIWAWDASRRPAKLRESTYSAEVPSLAEFANEGVDDSLDSWPEVRAVRKELGRHRFGLRVVHNPRNPDENLTLVWDVKSELQRMLLLLVHLDELGQLWRIRRCRQCRRWFCARKADHWQCSTRCRVALHQSSPEFKRVRAAYMRRRRKEESERERRILNQVSLHTGKGTQRD